MEVANHSTTDEVVCLLTGVAPTTDNVASTRGNMLFGLMSSMGFTADGAASPTPASASGTVDEINCFLTGVAPTAFNVAEARAAKENGLLAGAAAEAASPPANASFSSHASASSVDEVNCLLTGMAPTEANVSLAEYKRTEVAAAGTSASAELRARCAQQVPAALSHPMARKLSVRRVATMLGPM